jgi:hypothetical protein
LTDRADEKIEGIFRNFLSRRRLTTIRTNCPNEEILASYLSRLLEDEEAAQLEAHLAQCSRCVEDVVAVYKSSQEAGGKKVRQQVIDRAMSLASGGPYVFDLVIRLIKNSLELVSTSGQLVSTRAPLTVRSKPERSDITILRVEKELAEFKVTLKVEHVEAGLCQLEVRTEAEGKKPVEGIRLSLFSGGREQASYLARRGQAVFDRLPPGTYNLALSDSGTPVGTIRLGLTE